jgi:hypothetical protein
LAQKEQQRIELEEKRKIEAEEKAYRIEQERIETSARLEKERVEKAAYDKYVSNSLSTGSTPYSYCFGRKELARN